MLTAGSASPCPLSRRSNQARWTSSALMNPRFESSEPHTGVHGSCVHGHTTSRCSACPASRMPGVVVDRPAQEAVVPAGEVERRDGDAASSRRRCSSASSSRRASGGRSSRGSRSEARVCRARGRSWSGSVPVLVGHVEERRSDLVQGAVVAVSAGRVVGEEERPGHRPAEEDRAVRVDPAVVGLRRREAGADRGQAWRPRSLRRGAGRGRGTSSRTSRPCRSTRAVPRPTRSCRSRRRPRSGTGRTRRPTPTARGSPARPRRSRFDANHEAWW